MKIILDVPDLVDQTPDELARRIKLYAALLMVHAGEMSAGAACQFAGVDRYALMAEAKRHGLALIDYPSEDLEEELEEQTSGS